MDPEQVLDIVFGPETNEIKPWPTLTQIEEARKKIDRAIAYRNGDSGVDILIDPSDGAFVDEEISEHGVTYVVDGITVYYAIDEP